MIGNISKVCRKGSKGEKGEKGDTPAVVFLYNKEDGNLYYSSDGILIDKDYINSNVLKVTAEIKDGVLILK